MRVLNTKEFLEILNIDKLSIRDIKLPEPRLLPNELVRKYNLVFNKITGRYNCDGDVKIGKDLVKDGKLITDFGIVKGFFDCSSNELTSLEGCPAKVGGGFICYDNQLTSLEGCPAEVGSTFNCSSNRLVSLEGCPVEVSCNFYCNRNQLTSLEGCPTKVGCDFNCSMNNLASLEGCPVKVGGGFDCSYNELFSLEGCPAEVGGGFWSGIQKNGHKFTVAEVKALCNVKYKIHI